MRIEDTDRARLVKGAEENIVETLRIFGLDFDEGPFRQSEHLERYQECANQLLSKGAAYEDAGALRFRMPKEGLTEFTDIIRGGIQIENKTQEDFVILKSDGWPTYNLAHLVDDHDMAITHVIRGDEFISSMPKYIALHKVFGWDIPQYAHLPLLLNKERAKLSKREGEVAVRDFLDDGYLKEAVLNFVALLGWHPSRSDREIFALEDLVKEFRLENVQKSGAILDLAKLDWMNGEYIRKKSPGEILKIVESLGMKSSEKIIALEQPRLKKLSQLPEKTDYFFKEPEYSKELLRWKGEEDYAVIKKHLGKIMELWPEEEKVTAYAESEGRGEVLWPFRAALSGRKASPGPFEIAEILGKEEALRRIQKAIEMLQ